LISSQRTRNFRQEEAEIAEFCNLCFLCGLLFNLCLERAYFTVTAARVVTHSVQKRGGRSPGAGGSPAIKTDLDSLLSDEPTPELSAMLAENCAMLLTQLEPVQQRIARRKLEGYTNAEIATELDCGLRTVERRLELIRRVWDRAEDEDCAVLVVAALS
jgi:DNA-directed RNA polymerase specialized sigma24 family protein